MRILDATAGKRAVWFEKQYPDAVYIDVRPDGDTRNLLVDCRRTDFENGSFDLIIFDPPHMNCGPKSQMAARYGHWLTADIRDLVRDAFVEFHRLLRPDGLVAFKWNDHDTPLERILAPVSGFDKLVGVPTAVRTKHSSTTYWVLMRRVNGRSWQTNLSTTGPSEPTGSTSVTHQQFSTNSSPRSETSTSTTSVAPSPVCLNPT